MGEKLKVVQEYGSLSPSITSEVGTDTVQLGSEDAELETDLQTSDLVPDLSCESPNPVQSPSPMQDSQEDDLESPFCQHFDPFLYDRPDVAALLYDGSTMTVLRQLPITCCGLLTILELARMLFLGFCVCSTIAFYHSLIYCLILIVVP